MGSQTESFAIPPCGRGTTVGRVFLRCPDSKESCGAVPSPPVGSGRAIPTQHIHASVLQALVLLSLLPRLEFLCSCRDRICLVGPSRDSPSMFFLSPSPQRKCLTKKGSFLLATVSIVAAVAIGQSVLHFQKGTIRLCKEKVWQGLTLPRRYCYEWVP